MKDWQTSLFLECRVGIYDGLIDGLWRIDRPGMKQTANCRLSKLGKPSENARWFSKVWNPRGQLSAALVKPPISHIDYHNYISQLKKY